MSDRKKEELFPYILRVQLGFSRKTGCDLSVVKGISNKRNKTAVRKLSSCPNGYIIIFICEKCGIVSRGSNVFCPSCHKTRFIMSCKSKSCQANCAVWDEFKPLYCSHITQVINRDVPHAFYYPPWAFVTDIFMHMEEHLVDYTRREIAGSIKYDMDSDSFSAVSSLDFLSITTRLEETGLANAIKTANLSQSSPQDHRDFLKPNYDTSFEKILHRTCMFVFLIVSFLARFTKISNEDILKLDKEVHDLMNDNNNRETRKAAVSRNIGILLKKNITYRTQRFFYSWEEWEGYSI